MAVQITYQIRDHVNIERRPSWSATRENRMTPRRERTLLTFAIIAPMLVSAVARSYGWIITMGPEGLLSRLGSYPARSGIRPL